MSRVTLKNLVKEYDSGVLAVKGINLEIEEGEFMVLVGPSGCGKSTTLRMIAGLEGVSSGTISIGERGVNEVEPKDRKISMVFQNYALYPHMSAYDNIAFGLQMEKRSAQEIEERVQKAASMLEIGPLLKRRPKEMSGGQRQRVALGRALVRNPEVYLLDEPLSNLDAKLRNAMRIQIASLHKTLGATFIYVTHDQVEAMTMGDRITIMNGGEIMQCDTPLNVYHHPNNVFVAEFIGSPKINILAGELGEDDQMVINGVAMKIPDILVAADREGPILVGLRPEHIELDDTGRSAIVGKVKVVEQMGNEELVHLDWSGIPLTMRRSTAQTVTDLEGKEVGLVFRFEKANYFDPETGSNIAKDDPYGI